MKETHIGVQDVWHLGNGRNSLHKNHDISTCDIFCIKGCLQKTNKEVVIEASRLRLVLFIAD